MSVDVRYKVDLKDADGNIVSALPPVAVGFNQEQLMANPNFPTTYAIIRELARSGLATVEPDFVENA
jgi:hypothetical protein